MAADIHAEINTSQTLVTTAETAILSANTQEAYGGTGLAYQGGGPPQGVPANINAVVNVTPGAASTGLTLRVRHGVNSVAGAVVGVPVTVPAVGGTIEFTDVVGELNGYTITAQQVAATGNGTVNAVAVDINVQ